MTHLAAPDTSTPSTPSTPSDADALEAAKMQRFMSWMQEHSATFTALSATGAHGARQINATQPLLEGQPIAYIPRALMIPPNVARESKIGKQIAKLASVLSDYEYLTAYLLQVKHEGGFWKPYVDVLPGDYSEHPLFFSEEVVEELKGSYMMDSVLRRRSRNATLYWQLRPCLEEYGITREEYAWAACVVATRFHRRFEGGRCVFLAMVPLSDMFDHATLPNVKWNLDSDGGLCITARHPIDAGGRLFQNYGVGNSGLLEQYGFCVEGNPLNVAEIRLPELAQERLELWERVGGEHAYPTTLRVTRNCNDAAAQRLFSYLRIVCFEESSNFPLPVVSEDKSERVGPISRRNEIAALSMLAEACQAGLRAFRTSLEEDEALLKAGGLSRNLHNVVMVRRDEKIILNYFLDLTRIVLPALRTCDGSKLAAESPYAAYFAEIATKFQAECTATSNAVICSSIECADSEEARMHRLSEWLDEQGATFSSTVKIDARARQLHAARRLLPGQFYMHIPKRLLITPEVAKQSKIGQLIDQHGCTFGSYEYMAAFLMQTKREGGFWKSYVDMLPPVFSNHSLFFSESELEHLKGSDLFRTIPERKADNEGFYNQLPPSVKEAYTLEEFTWGRCIAITRSFGVRFEGKRSMALVPLADMLDHSLNSNSRYIPESENGFILTARRQLEAHSALVTSYGGRSNGHLLNTYGFCLGYNPHNEVEILLQPLREGHPFAEHTKKLGVTMAGMQAFRLRHSCTDDAASAVLSYLRLAHSDASLRIDNAEVQADKAGKISPISCENEITVLTALAQECARRLSEYLTSIAEDDALLKDSTLPRNVRNMVKVRRDEKVILNYWLDLTRTALPALAKDVFDVSGHTATGSVYADYFAEIGQRFGSGAECKG